MKKLVKNIVSAISIIAIILAPLPKNVVTVASDIVETEIETTETETIEEITEKTSVETTTETVEETAEETTEETTEETIVEETIPVANAENPITASAIYNGTFGWAENGGSYLRPYITTYGSIRSIELSELGSTITLEVPDYYLPDENVSVSVNWARYEYVYDSVNGFYNWLWIEDIQPEANGSLVTRPINKSDIYTCELTAEGYGTILWDYTLSVESGLNWNNIRPGMDSTQYYNYSVEPGSTQILNVPGYSINDGVDYTVTWSVYTGNEWDSDQDHPLWYFTHNSDFETLTVDGGDSFTTPAVNMTTYYCALIVDEYGNFIDSYYQVCIDSGLRWNTSDYDTTRYRGDITVNAGESTTIDIPAFSINDGVQYSISAWECDYNIIEGTEGQTSYVTPAITGKTTYTVRITDEYGNSIIAYFNIRVNSGLMWADCGGYYSDVIYVNPGETTDIRIPDVQINPGENYTVSWKVNTGDGYVTVDGATGTSYITPPINKRTYYSVTVTDNYDNYISAFIDILIDTGLSWGNGETYYSEYVYARPGETATLTLPQILINDGFQYTINSWTNWGSNITTGTVENSVGQASITTLPVNGNITYYASASDSYGNTINAAFYVRIGSGIYWESTDPQYYFQDITVGLGATYLLELPEIINPNNEHYTIEWSYSGTVVESAADQLSCTTIEIIESITYNAVITDDYGNRLYAFFNVSVEGGGGSGLQWFDGTEMTSQEIYVSADASANLSLPSFIINPGETYTISWLWFDLQDMMSDGRVIDEAAGQTSYTTFPIVGPRKFSVTIRDNYNKCIYADFYVYIGSGNTDPELSWENGETEYMEYVYARPGETATLTLPQILINNGGQYTIGEWTYSVFNVGSVALPNSAGQTSVTTLPVDGSNVYNVSVSDNYGNTIRATFYVRIGSGLHWESGDSQYYSQDVYVNSGETTVLQLPEFVIPEDEHYTIEWSYSPPSIGTMQPDIVVESAADQISCTTIEIFEYISYHAVVTDDYGNSIYASFYINVESGGGSGLQWYDGTEMTSQDIYVSAGESAWLSIPSYNINSGETCTIEWYHLGEGVIEGNDSIMLMTSEIYGYEQYEATVTDNYGYSIYVVFYVRVRTNLSWDEGAIGYSQDYYVNIGDTLELDLPTIHIADGESYTISWQWFDLNEMMSEGNPIDEAAGQTSYTTFPITGPINFNVTVKDSYNSCIYANFNVYIEGGNTDTGLSWVDWDDNWSTIHTVQPNHQVYLAVPEIHINEGYNYVIQWEAQPGMDWEPIEGATGNGYLTPALTQNTYYRATVSDGYGHYLYYYVNVEINSGLSWEGSSYSNIPVKYEDDYTLTLPPFNIADDLTAGYTWYKNEVLISGENGPELELIDITESATYECYISDGYNTISATFVIRVNTELKWSNGTPYYHEDIYLAPNGSCTLTMPSYEVMTGIDTTYQWYKTAGTYGTTMDYVPVTCESDGSVEVTDLQTNIQYYCQVTDQCGNSISAYYTIYVDSGLAWADGSARYNQSTLYAELGEPYNLTIPAINYNGDISEEITYEWYLMNPDTYCYELRQDITDNTLYLNSIQKRTSGYVEIRDPYGNSLTWSFEVKVNTGLFWKDGNTFGNLYVEVPYGGTAEIRIPEFTINDNVDYTIRVSGRFGDQWNSLQVGANDVVTSDPITDQTIYNITIDDQYDNGISYSIYYRNNYSLSWENGTLYNIQNVNMDSLSDTVTLQLPEYVYDGGAEITVTWSGAEGTASADSRSYTVNGVEQPSVVYARVSDNRYSTILAAFYLGTASTLSFDDGTTQKVMHISAQAGENLTLYLPTINSMGALTYMWSRVSKDSATGFNKGNLGTGDTLQISNAAFSSYYYACLITDEAGHSIRALYDILAPSHEFDSHGECTLCGEYEAQAQYVSITLDGRIGINFYVKVDEQDVYEGAYAVMTHDEDSETVLLSEALKGSISSQSVYKLTYYVDAKEMNDQVSLNLYDGLGNQIKMHNFNGEEIVSYNFSVAQYLSRVGDSGITEFNNLISRMSAYGTMAAKYFGKINHYSLDADMTAALADVTAGTVESYAALKEGTMPEGLSYYGSSLILDSDTSICHYFSLSSGHTIDEYMFTVDGQNVTPVAMGNMYRIVISGIPAAELSRTFETVVSDVSGGGGYTISYNALSYVYTALTYYDPVQYSDLVNTVKALYLYNISAMAYFDIRA